MNEAEIAALEAKATRLQKQIADLSLLKVRGTLKHNEWMKVYTYREQLHTIYTKLIHPDHLVLYQVDVEKFHLSRATDRKMVTDALNSRGYAWELDVGKQEIRFWRKTPGGDFAARALDVAEVREVRGVRVVTPTELKTKNALFESVKGGVRRGDINAEFKLRVKGHKGLGGQLAVEDWVKDLATRAKVDRIGVKGQDIVDDAVHRIEIAPENLEKSHVSAYETPDKKLFESARKTGAPSKPVTPPGGNGGTGSPSADRRKLIRPSTDSKGS